MRRLWTLVFLGAWFSAACSSRNALEPSAGNSLNNGTAYHGIVEAPSNDVLFAPTAAGQTLTNPPFFGGPIMYSWGGASTTVTQASAPVPLASSPPTNNVWLLTGGSGYPNGIGGPTGNYGPTDYYIRWAGHKGPDASLDYSSMTMYLIGNQTNYNLAAHHYRGFIFYARGHGNFYVALAGSNLGDPYQTFNFYTAGFGSQLTGDNQWHQITVLFSDMTQLYGQAVDINHVLSKCWGLQFDQEVPLQSDFQLDVDYVRFF